MISKAAAIGISSVPCKPFSTIFFGLAGIFHSCVAEGRRIRRGLHVAITVISKVAKRLHVQGQPCRQNCPMRCPAPDSARRGAHSLGASFDPLLSTHASCTTSSRYPQASLETAELCKAFALMAAQSRPTGSQPAFQAVGKRTWYASGLLLPVAKHRSSRARATNMRLSSSSPEILPR
jgi:hypothetical protein